MNRVSDIEINDKNDINDSSLGRAEIASFVRLVLFKDEERRVTPRFHPHVSYVNHWNEEAGKMERFYLDLPRAVKNRVCTLETGCGSVV